jgi:hypothetical protein
MLNLQVGFFFCRGTSNAENILYSLVILRLQPLKEFLEEPREASLMINFNGTDSFN